MKLQLKNLFTDENSKIDFDVHLDFTEILINGEYPFIKPVHVFGQAKNMLSIVELEYTVEFAYIKECDRCCEITEKGYVMKFLHPLTKKEDVQSKDEPLIVLNDELDLNEIVFSDVVLDLPIKHICSEDCKGLCTVCGINLNTSNCNCLKKQVDPRLEILKQFMK